MEEECHLLTGWLPDEEGMYDLFDRLLSEVSFEEMSNFGSPVPRLVAVQAIPGPSIRPSDYCPEESVARDDIPIYRHPTDSSLKSTRPTATVARIIAHANRELGSSFNHALIQLYRTGHDCISEHSDKTLDIVPGSCIVNASFGAQRTMTLRYKANKQLSQPTITNADRATDAGDGRRENQSIAGDGKMKNNSTAADGRRENKSITLPHNSLLIMPLSINASWTHAIRPNKRLLRDQCEEERACDGRRISITIREIGTFITPDGRIYGSGATCKSRDTARVIDDTTEAWADLVSAFGRENRGREVNFKHYYGLGSDALK